VAEAKEAEEVEAARQKRLAEGTERKAAAEAAGLEYTGEEEVVTEDSADGGVRAPAALAAALALGVVVTKTPEQRAAIAARVAASMAIGAAEAAAKAAEDETALWHVVHDDGDEEDLEEEEVLAARTLFFKRREFLQKAVGIACRTLHDVVWGVRPLEPVERGAFVCEFAGQIQLRCVPFRGKGKRGGGGGRGVPQCARRSVCLRGCGLAVAFSLVLGRRARDVHAGGAL
jgi:hypothetical protein